MAGTELSIKRIIKVWWPLAASWMLMGLEGPMMTAVMARLAHPEISLAAYGGVVYPMALIIETPVIMLLSASTALSKDNNSYRLMQRFMMLTGISLSTLHFLVAVTPLYDVVISDIMGAQPEVATTARIGVLLLTPWTWSIAYRRFNQGVLIRNGYSGVVGSGTIIRLLSNTCVLAIGYQLGTIPGVAVASAAQAMGVVNEAIYIGIRVRPVLRKNIYPVVAEETLTTRAFLKYYLPLVATSFLTLIWQPLGSAAMNRMSQPIESLAVWQVLSGYIFINRTLGIAFNEVVVALLDGPAAYRALRRFATYLTATLGVVFTVLTLSPFLTFWLQDFAVLTPDLVQLGLATAWIAIPVPALTVLQSWYQGAILTGNETRGITESTVMFIVAAVLVLAFGILWGRGAGLYYGMTSLLAANAAQTIWVYFRSRPMMRSMAPVTPA
ncbi:MAG: hypothetical protein HPY76_06865 [Anaerolineae bacterium]|nr:hypothetical protein [Anaerolineae bacterium]